LYPAIAIAHALRARGHACTFYTGPPGHQTVVEEGFECHPFKRVDQDAVHRTMLSQASGQSRAHELPSLRSRLRRWLVDTIPQQLADLREIMATNPPDVIVTDPTMWGPVVVLHDLGFPVAVASFMPGCLIPGPDAPPFGLGLPPPRTAATRLLSRVVTTGSHLFAGEVRRAVNALRREHGLAPIAEPVIEYMGRLPLYLVPGVAEFDYHRRDLPPSVQYVGPFLWNRPRSAGEPGWLDRIPRERPWVHVTEGTFHGGEPFLVRAALRGLADLPVEVIITTGTDRDPREIVPGGAAPNMHVTRWVSHSELLPSTSVVVTTGGAGSVLATLSAGCPMVIVPTELDKPDNARRVEAAGAGVRLTPRRCTPRRLRDAVERVLTDPTFTQNARRLADLFARPGGARRAAELLEHLGSSHARGAGIQLSRCAEVIR
jgi:MGT family glycosyltransferase